MLIRQGWLPLHLSTDHGRYEPYRRRMRPTRSEASRTGGGRGCKIGTVAELMHLLSFRLLFTLKRSTNFSRDFVAPSKGLPFSGLMLRRFDLHIAMLRRCEKSPSQSQTTKLLSARPTIMHNRAAHPEKSKEFFCLLFICDQKKGGRLSGRDPTVLLGY